MSSKLNAMLNHAILTESICEQVREGGNVNNITNMSNISDAFTSNLNAMLNHAILTESICKLVRKGGNGNNRYSFNNNVYNGDETDEDDNNCEYWSFGFMDEEEGDENLQMQCVTCLKCGNYILCSAGIPNCENVRCKCPYDLDDKATYDKNMVAAREKNELMNKYVAFDAFVMEMLPEQVIMKDPDTQKISIFQDYPDRLCEDVIGEISRFLI